MEKGLFDITTTGTTELVGIGSKGGNVKSISVCNYNTAAVSVSVYLEDEDSNKSYYIYNVKIPANVTINLTDVAFSNSVLALKLNTPTATPKLSVIIK